MGLMLSCKETSELIIKKDTEELKFYDRMRLMMHLSMCKFCSLFEKQNNFINSNIKALDDKVVKEFEPGSKEKILQNIKNN
ncbi:MAG: hypothetical protein DRJ05_10885 [Bacteroidetes bacterium]|nr:MAG: hypothetical protein DRJ05_10885 [Bacteroidota bacterium]